MQDLSIVLTSLSVAAGLALAVERCLELFKSLLAMENGFLSKEHRRQAVSDVKQAEERAKAAIARVGQTEAVEAASTDMSDSPVKTSERMALADEEPDEVFLPPKIAVLPIGEKSEVVVRKKLFLQLMAVGLGIILAYVFNVRLIYAFLSNLGYANIESLTQIDLMISGMVIGGGSQPIHLLIRFLTDRTVNVPSRDKANKPVVVNNAHLTETDIAKNSFEQTLNPVNNLSFEWQTINYRGGVNPESMDSKHLRGKDPDKIIFHHTAMSSTTPFQTVVDEFLVNKKWLTGYHCVIMPDGAIKPFCRWDRYGNHAKGLNKHSLGIAFHGNFHLDKEDKYSNMDGRYGNKKPTPEQVHAGARVIALWCALYPDIEADFKRHIMSHGKAIPGHTVCAGSHFPDKELEKSVNQFLEVWQQSDQAQQEIEAFKQRDYVYA